MYQHRVRVPADLVTLLNRTHINSTLKTTDHREAIRRWREKQGQVEEFFESKRLEFGLTELSRMANQRLDLAALDDGHIEHLVVGWYLSVLKHDKRADITDLADTELRQMLNEMAQEVTRYRTSNDDEVLRRLDQTADQILLRHGAPFEVIDCPSSGFWGLIAA